MSDRKLRFGGEAGRMSSAVEVVMRPPEVFLRELSSEEGFRLRRLSKAAKHAAKRERALICWASATGQSAPVIARLVGSDESHVRKVIHAFNERGFSSLDPDYRGGRPRRISEREHERIVAVAGVRPDSIGVPLTRWSLRRLSAQLAEQERIAVSPSHLGRLLTDAGLSFQRTRTWKASPDPDYERKATRVISLCKRPPKGSAVISFDQMGPVSLRPMPGAGWASQKRPERQRADYSRRSGTRYIFGAYHVHQDRLRTRMRPRRRGQDVLAFMRQIRLCYPRRVRLYWIQDNLSANWTPDIREFAAQNNIELVPTPTYASYLNPIECHFTPISQFVFGNADYLDWEAANWAHARHIQHRNGTHRGRRLAELEQRHRIAA